jgi:hypothetical protein
MIRVRVCSGVREHHVIAGLPCRLTESELYLGDDFVQMEMQLTVPEAQHLHVVRRDPQDLGGLLSLPNPASLLEFPAVLPMTETGCQDEDVDLGGALADQAIDKTACARFLIVWVRADAQENLAS